MEFHHPGHQRDGSDTVKLHRPGSAPGREEGSGAIDLVLVAAFVLFPFAMLMLSFPILLEYRSMGDAAAREAVRACAGAPDPSTGQVRAEGIARLILSERGLSPSNATVVVDCRTAWAPDQVVTATVSFDVPAVDVMGIGRLGSVTVERSYREKIEPHRSAP